MAHYHRPRWGAISLGCLCATGAGAILLQDIKHTGAVTVDHGLSVIVLVGTIAAGHMATGEARQLRPIRATVLALIFLLGSAWCIGSTAGRQAEGQAIARTAVADANRMLILKGQELDAARKRLAVATSEVERECRTGFGRVCAGWQATERERQAHVAALVAEIGRLGPTRVGDQKLSTAAAVAAMLTGGDAPRIESALIVLWPFLPALFLELGSIAFFAIGLPRGRVDFHQAASVPAPKPHPEPRKSLPESITRSLSAARHPVIEALERQGGSVGSNAELALLMSVSEGEASKRVAEVAGSLIVERVGKQKRIRLR